MIVDSLSLSYKEINEKIDSLNEPIVLENVLGQRYIASGSSGKDIKIHGIAGNSLASFLDGSKIELFSNAQDALGDTMNDGLIIVHGAAGDAAGYSMRGGKIYIRGNSGYRTGVHMKAYMEKSPLIIIGGSVGSFLGEYLSGGTIVVLGLGEKTDPPVGFFTAKGMHGGRIIIRSSKEIRVDKEINVKKADEKDKENISSTINEFCQVFNLDRKKIVEENDFYILTPSTTNPYKRLYTPI